MKVAIQGQKASFHDLAVRQYLKRSFDLINCDNFKSLFQALNTGKADIAMVALENSLYGTINETYDLLMKHKNWIIGEQYIRVEFCLIGLPGAKIDNITEVHSQVFAFGECDSYLEDRLVKAKRFEEHDTAGSVELIKNAGDLSKAAIASKEAAELHGMSILDRQIETHHQNYTRFALITAKQQTVEGANKSSLVLTTKSDTKPGALLRALKVFSDRNINMTMLQSRPLIGEAWHYLFYVDVEIGSSNPEFDAVIQQLEKAGCHTTILGSYRANNT